MAHVDKPEDLERYKSMIGKQVRKKSKPFKSGNKINTVISMCVNQITKQHAFLFLEDDSQVECFRCHLIRE